MTVDIVIPVYNAYEFLTSCVASIRKNTEPGTYRIIAVDDCSTDGRISEYLDSIREEDVRVFRNSKNLGFVGSVNFGMGQSVNDVVLLNSDTEVTRGWLKKMEYCAYSSSEIATVTPFTNSGTICSVPNYCQDNEIPAGYTVDTFAELIEKVSVHEYPEIPTAVGFCMYIKRSVLDAIGLFDYQTFKKGYGEENDFCYRAIAKGYVNVLCDDTFIWHKGTASFTGTEKAANVAAAMKILDERYPAQRRATTIFVEQNPMKHLIDNIQYSLFLANGKKSLMYVIHMPVDDTVALGGTQKHVRDLRTLFSDEYNVFVLWPKPGQGLHVSAIDGERQYEFFFRTKWRSQNDYFNYATKQTLAYIFDLFRISLLHIHHGMWMTRDIFLLAKERNIPLVFTAHDFYEICPTVNLLNGEFRFCNIPDEKACRQCLKARDIDVAIHEWRMMGEKALRLCDTIVVPNGAEEAYFRKVYGDMDFVEIEHGVGTHRVACTQKQPDNGKFRVAFVGMIAKHKGCDLIRELICENKDPQVEWHLFGGIEDRRILKLRKKAVIHGPYQDGDIVRLLLENRIDLVCMLPIWPETYSYVLTEAWTAGLPVLAFDLGAVGERIRRTGYGYLIPFGSDTQRILSEITEIRNGDASRNRIRSLLADYAPVSIREMGRQYAAMYRRLIAAKTPVFHNVSHDRSVVALQVFRHMYRSISQRERYAKKIRSLLEKGLPKPLVERLFVSDYPLKKTAKWLILFLIKVYRKIRHRGTY